MALTETVLSSLLGKHIREICPLGYAADTDNHCAHFVSHVLGFQFDTTCRTMVTGTGTSASIRVQDVFSHCLQVGNWNGLPTPLYWGLVFITNANNVNINSKQMVNIPRKHVGIFFGGLRSIYHYSNSRHQVVTQTPAEFSNHYPAPDNAMFWGSAP
jgi:hypothetical protein